MAPLQNITNQIVQTPSVVRTKLVAASPDMELLGGSEKPMVREGWHFETAKAQVFAAAAKVIKHKKSEKEVMDIMQRQIEALKREKRALTRLGRGYFTTKLQAWARGEQVRHWIQVVRPLFLVLQAQARGRQARAYALRRKEAIFIQQAWFRGRAAANAYAILRISSTKISTKYRRNASYTRFQGVKDASLKVSTVIRLYLQYTKYKSLRTASLLISKHFRGHTIRRQQVKAYQTLYLKKTMATRLTALLLAPSPDLLVLTTKVINATTWLEARLKPEHQPIAIQLKIDTTTGDLGLFFIANPQTDIRQVLAPYPVSGVVELTLLNSKKLNSDVTVRIDQNDLNSNQGTGIFKRRVYLGAATVGVQRLVSRSQINNFLHIDDTLVLTVRNILPPKEVLHPQTHDLASNTEPASLIGGRGFLAAVASSATCPLPTRRAFIL